MWFGRPTTQHNLNVTTVVTATDNKVTKNETRWWWMRNERNEIANANRILLQQQQQWMMKTHQQADVRRAYMANLNFQMHAVSVMYFFIIRRNFSIHSHSFIIICLLYSLGDSGRFAFLQESKNQLIRVVSLHNGEWNEWNFTIYDYYFVTVTHHPSRLLESLLNL